MFGWVSVTTVGASVRAGVMRLHRGSGGVIRAFCKAGLLLGGLLAPAGAALSADLGAPPPLKSQWYDPSRGELRVGGFSSVNGPEYGKASVDVAFILPKPKFDLPPGMPDYAVPRIQFGGMFNVSGGTSFAYADLLWTLNITPRWFLEPYVGGAIHNGQLDGPDPGKASLGCRANIHAGANFGYRIDQHWSVMATFDHISNAKALSGCVTNQGLNLGGLRVGYAF